MPGHPDDPVLALLRRMEGKIDEIRADLRDMKQSMSTIDVHLASANASLARLHAGFVGQSSRFDRVDASLRRIERRLDVILA